MNMSRFIRRPSLWLPGVTIAFSVYASLDAYLTNALPSSVGAFILSGMVFVISGLCVSAAWDAARLHGVAKNLGRRRNMLRLLAWILIPCWIWTALAFGVLWAYQMWLFGMVVYPHPLTVLLAALMGFVWSLMGVVFVWVFPRVEYPNGVCVSPVLEWHCRNWGVCCGVQKGKLIHSEHQCSSGTVRGCQYHWHRKYCVCISGRPVD